MQIDKNGWLDVAQKIDYTNKSMDRQGYTIKDVVVHATAGGTSAEAIGIFFRDGGREASAHFIIDQVGKIVQGIPLVLAAWGNGILSPGHAPFIPNNINPNFYTVSIEHVKAHDDNSDQLTPIQTQKSFELIKCLCDTYGIPKRAGDANGGILAHNQITQTACPGPYPWDALYNYLKGGNKPMPPQPPTANQIKAANNRWNSVLKNTVAGPAPTGSGIYNAWLADYTQSKFHGPPLTHEYDSVDWNGKPIIIQEFSYGWAEWTGKVTWYDAEGAMG